MYSKVEQATNDKTENRDIRGFSFAVVNKNGRIITSGSIPKLIDGDDDSAKINYYKKLADAYGGDLYLGGNNLTELKDSAQLIMGCTWQEIQDLQMGKHTRRAVSGTMPKNAVLVYSPEAKPTTTAVKEIKDGA